MNEKRCVPDYRLPLVYTTILVAIMNICNMMAFKVLNLFGFYIAMSGFLFPTSFYFLSALNESYGHRETEKAILMVMIAQNILFLVVSLAVRAPSPPGVHTTQLYLDLYSNLWKLFISSNLAVGLSFYSSSLFNSRLKVWLLGKGKVMRFIVSTGIAKFILVSISYPINFYGILPVNKILMMCISTWIFKMVAAFILSQFVYPLVKINRKIDQVDIYDINISYNPLRVYKTDSPPTNMYGKSYS